MNLLDPNLYTIAWIAPLEIEARAALLLLDTRHQGRFPLSPGDDYIYEAGEMCGHNVIIATLPSGQEYGTGAATAISSQVKKFFPRLWLGLLVGVAAGLPNMQRNPPLDIRLGDVLVGLAEGDNAGLIAYDLGKETSEDGFQPLRFGHVLAQTETLIRSAIGSIKLNAPDDAEVFLPYYAHFQDKQHSYGSFADPGQENDVLYQIDDDGSERPVPREPRPKFKRTRVWYGPIGSGDKLMKNARKRNELRDRYNVIGLEMEAAGTMNRIPVGVIRGVCDYGDEHKNKQWQPYAAAMAAAYAKAVLAQIPPKVAVRVEGQVIDVASGARSRPKHPLDESSSSIGNRKAKSPRIDNFDAQSVQPRLTQVSIAQQRSLDEEQKKWLLDSLAFDQIDSRHDTIEKAYGKTCKWLSTTPEYLDWLEPNKIHEHHGFLWIKGNPGAGKSTLMKFAFHDTREATKSNLISFFFNARGGGLEKSTTGMYRSLLLQLLEKIPRLQSTLHLPRQMRQNGNILQWSLESLKLIFEQAIKNLEQSPLTCFIDALDECGESEIRDMISFFEAVAESAVSEGLFFRVCLSSRHYPHITIAKGLTLDLGQQEGHGQDIVSYVKGKLKIGSGKLAEQVRSRLIEKASGVFIWVVLVVRILTEDFDHGHAHSLLRRLQDIPKDLNDLFRDITTRDNRNKGELLLCIQWVLFARQTLRQEQLYLAILVGVDAGAASAWHPDEIEDAVVKRFILSSSKGLVEVNKSKKNPKVQFIHESVREFFLKENWTKTWPELEGSFQAEGHERLKQCCLEYIGVSAAALEFELPVVKAEKNSQQRSTERWFPLLEYAFRNGLYHADEAAAAGVSQAKFAQNFDLVGWLRFEPLFEKHLIRHHRSTVSLLYILAEYNAANLINCHPDKLSGFDVEENERYGMPVLAAVATNSRQAVYALLKAHADAQPSTPSLQGLCEQYLESEVNRNGTTRAFQFSKSRPLICNLVDAGDDLFLAFALASPKVNRDEVLGHSRGLKMLHDAAWGGREFVIRLLADRDPNLTAVDWRRGRPLQLAAKAGHEGVVRLLLDREFGAYDPCADGSALPLAAGAGHEGVVQLLLDRGASIEASNGSGSTPLHLATCLGREGIARVLLDRGASIKASDSYGSTLLHIAAFLGTEGTARVLLDRGAGIEASDSYGLTPLHLAISMGNEGTARVLLNTGANIEASDGNGSTPLHRAIRHGLEGMVRLLLERGANIEAIDQDGLRPLHDAAMAQDEVMVRLLLDVRANIEATTNAGMTPLLFAAAHGRIAILKLLLDHNADINRADHGGHTALVFAADLCWKDDAEQKAEAVQLLLDKGADVEIVRYFSGAALSFSARSDNSTAVELLRDKIAKSTTSKETCTGCRFGRRDG